MNESIKEKILILGFYNRKNLGDDTYILAFSKLFQYTEAELTFQSLDDATSIPDDITTIICGGGDIINDYFMKKAIELLKNFTGRVYAVSVGIPFASSTKYLHMFDHVFTRSKTDYNMAVKEIGSKNVTCLPTDIATVLSTPRLQALKIKSPSNNIRLGLCLAQPYFYNNPNKNKLTRNLAKALVTLQQNHPNKTIEFHFLSFNYNTAAPHECDYEINNEITKLLIKSKLSFITHHTSIDTPYEMMQYISTYIDITICMRYHSMIFSWMTNTPFVPVYCSNKADNFLTDLGFPPSQAYKLPIDSLTYQPTDLNTNTLLEKITQLTSPTPQKILFSMPNFQSISNIIISQKKYAQLLVTSQDSTKYSTFDEVLAIMRQKLPKYLQIDISTYDSLLSINQPIPIKDPNKTPLQVARFICYLVSGRTHHPCIWGLAENLTSSSFNLLEATKYIWTASNIQDASSNISGTEFYFPSLKYFKREVLLNLDFIFQNDFSQYHRSGWSYVVGGLMNIDAPRMLKTSDTLLDVYVDRSFHWGLDIMVTLGILPYKNPWYGFIHHTFDETHSGYNCVGLFKNKYFLDSLSQCRGLFALTKYLATQIRAKLDELGMDVPVFVLYHPMEFVDNMFTVEKYIANRQKKVVQIGAWLRNPYALYELPLSSACQIQKVALKGKEMDQYFAPPGFFEVLEETLLRRDWYHEMATKPTSVCRPSPTSINKYCSGMYEMLFRNHNSVSIINNLSNEEYDQLLSKNIVFLNLVDCSAVNTVLECIVRNTVLIVNRHPALEEVLGTQYPGFYSSLYEAAQMCQNIDTIKSIYDYLSKLDKTRYQLEFFIQQLQQAVTQGYTTDTFDLFAIPQVTNIFRSKYSNLLRYLPRKFK